MEYRVISSPPCGRQSSHLWILVSRVSEGNLIVPALPLVAGLSAISYLYSGSFCEESSKNTALVDLLVFNKQERSPLSLEVICCLLLRDCHESAADLYSTV